MTFPSNECPDCGGDLEDFRTPCNVSHYELLEELKSKGLYKEKYLTKEEIKILYDHFSHEFISYENESLIVVMKKIAEIANDR